MVKKISIAGLGLMGGSIAKAVRLYLPEIKIIAFDEYIDSLILAKESKIIDEISDKIDKNFASSDIVFIATPVDTCFEILSEISKYSDPSLTVTDLCSTKSEIFKFIKTIKPNFTFIGGHPMTGSEKFGFSASNANLYENAYYILCPQKEDNHYFQLKKIIEGINAIPIKISPDAHDKYLAYISHFPHIVAAGLVNLAKNEETNEGILRTLAAGGFKDITRIASSNPILWESIISSNRENIANAIEEFINILSDFKDFLVNDEPQNIIDFFENSKNYRDTFSQSTKGLIEKYSEISVDVPDEPGVIAEISVILKKSMINVKNIYIASSRELDSGALRIIFQSKDQSEKAKDILEQSGFSVRLIE